MSHLDTGHGFEGKGCFCNVMALKVLDMIRLLARQIETLYKYDYNKP